MSRRRRVQPRHRSGCPGGQTAAEGRPQARVVCSLSVLLYSTPGLGDVGSESDPDAAASARGLVARAACISASANRRRVCFVRAMVFLSSFVWLRCFSLAACLHVEEVAWPFVFVSYACLCVVPLRCVVSCLPALSDCPRQGCSRKQNATGGLT